MLIDEPMDMNVLRPFKASMGGGFFDVKTLTLLPPKPSMARQLYAIEQYFNKIRLEAAAFSASITSDAEMEQARADAHKVVPITPIKALHESYNEDSEFARDDKLKEIEDEISGIKTLISMCSGVDIFAMTNDFGKLMTQKHYVLCTVKGLDENQEAKECPMTMSLWENNVGRKDRLNIMIWYCCFFDLTSSLDD